MNTVGSDGNLAQGFKPRHVTMLSIAGIIGAGLFVGVELRHGGQAGAPAAAEAARVVNLLRERRVLISSAGPHGNVLKIRPPLPFGTEHADLLVETLDQALAELDLISEK